MITLSFFYFLNDKSAAFDHPPRCIHGLPITFGWSKSWGSQIIFKSNLISFQFDFIIVRICRSSVAVLGICELCSAFCIWVFLFPIPSLHVTYWSTCVCVREGEWEKRERESTQPSVTESQLKERGKRERETPERQQLGRDSRGETAEDSRERVSREKKNSTL